MTEPTATRVRYLDELRDIVSTVAVPYHEPPAVKRRRRIVVTVVLVIGGALLGYSLTRRPGDESFYWLMLALAAVWALGAFASGPLHLGSVRFRGRNQRPVITGTVVGLAVGGVFLVGGQIAREIPGVREFVVRVLDFANHGSLALVVLITVINGIAEELFFRGALYTARGRTASRLNCCSAKKRLTPLTQPPYILRCAVHNDPEAPELEPHPCPKHAPPFLISTSPR